MTKSKFPDLEEFEEQSLVEWGRKREEIIHFIKQFNLNPAQLERFFDLLHQYERLSRERSRLVTCFWLLREK